MMSSDSAVVVDNMPEEAPEEEVRDAAGPGNQGRRKKRRKRGGRKVQAMRLKWKMRNELMASLNSAANEYALGEWKPGTTFQFMWASGMGSGSCDTAAGCRQGQKRISHQGIAVQNGQQEVPTPKSFSNLHRHLKLLVFSFLPKCELTMRAALVCKEWYELSRDVNLWKEVQLRGWCMTAEKAIELLGWMTRLKTVSMVHWRDKGADDVVTTIAYALPELEVLELKAVTFNSMAGLFEVAQMCKLLKDLKLKAVMVPDGSTNFLDVFALSPQLEKLTIERTRGSSLPPHFNIIREWPKLTEVNLYHRLSDTGCLNHEFRVIADSVGGQVVKLSIGEIDNYNVDGILHPLHEHLHKFEVLQDLSVSDLIGISERDFLESLGSLRHLRNLSLSYVFGMEADILPAFFSMREVVGNLESLELVECENLDDRSLMAISDNCPNLTQLNLHNCLDITEYAIQDVIRRCTDVKVIWTEGTPKL